MASDDRSATQPKSLKDWTDLIYQDNKLSNQEVEQFDREADAAIDSLIRKLEDLHAHKTPQGKLDRPALQEKPRGLKHFKSSCQLTSDLLQEALLSAKRSLPSDQFRKLQAEMKEAVMFQILYLKACLDRFD